MADESWPPGHDPAKTGVFCTQCNRSIWLIDADEQGRCNLHQGGTQQAEPPPEGSA